MFFKLFNNMYNSIEKTSFTEYNVNDFIEKINFSCSVIEEAFKLIMPVNINNKYFNPHSKGPCSGLIADNSMVTLLMSNIAYKDKIHKDELVIKNRSIIIYHLLCDKTYLKNIDEKILKTLKAHDTLTYQAGGSFVDNECKSILNGKNLFTITKEQMSNLLDEILKYSLNNRKNKSSSNKRRTLNMFDNKFETEHITPFSSTWNGEIDIDRIGNMFPTLEKINGKRGNKNLEIYYTEENKGFTNLIIDLLPTNYDDFNIRNGKKTHITSVEKYNAYCEKNEQLYVKTLLDNLFINQ